MNATLHERLIRAEQPFILSFLSNDEESLKVFSQEWSHLSHDIERTKAAGRLDDETARCLSKVSRAIESMANCMLESGEILQEMTCSISDFIQSIPPGDLSTPSLHPQAIASYHLPFSNVTSSIIPSILGQQMLLDSYAYYWLMQNLHDPYPNSVQTHVIGDASGTSVAQVELWFREVRDSIGWSKLSHDFFADSVNATVAAARRVYLEHDRDVSFDIVFAFTAVKASAETLFLEHPSLQGKKVDTGFAQTIQTMALDRGHHIGPFPDESIIGPESVLVPSQVDLPALPDPFSDLSDDDESEEEDTTPPPSIAGCKRYLSEDVFTSQVYDPVRPQKRRRIQSINWTPSEPARLPLVPSTLGLSSEQATPHVSATITSSSPSSHPLSPTSPESLPVPPPSVCQEGSYVELDENTPEDAVSSLHTSASAHGIRKRRLSQSPSPVSYKQQSFPLVPPSQHFTIDPTLPSDGCPDLFLPEGRFTDLDEALHPTLQVPANFDSLVNFGVFDWNSISDPLAERASPILQPAVVYVPSSGLTSQLLEPPDFGHDGKTSSSSLNDLASLEDLSSSLQLPIPAGCPPDLSTLTALCHSSHSSLPPQDLDWSTITEFINLFPPGSMQSSSPLTSTSALPTPPGNSHGSLSPPSCDTSKQQPLSALDLSVPPSVFLSSESGAFIEDVYNMWSFLRES